MENLINDQNKVLFFTSFTEFGERYSYYVIQALLIFFLLDRFHISQSTASSLVGTALSMIYISAIVGGFIADKLIGYYRAAMIGSILMVTGSFILSISHTENLLFVGLAFISISTGLIKSNMSSFLGKFYDKSHLSYSHRDFGFNIFYVGINFGSLFALFFASFLKDHYGFAIPFYSSLAVTSLMFMTLCVGTFKLRAYMDEQVISFTVIMKTAGVICLYIALVIVALKTSQIASIAIFVACILCTSILFRSAQGKYWKNVTVALLFFTLSTLYWSLYFQIFISILLFIDKTVSHQLFNFTLGSSQFLAIESLSVITLGTVMGKLWLHRGKIGKPVHDIDKFNLGFILIGLAFLFLYIITKFSDPAVKVPAIAIAIALATIAISELSLSAIGLSMVTKIAPKGYVSLYMGIWLVTLGVGGKIAGYLSSYVLITDNIMASKSSMASAFLRFFVLAVFGSIICYRLRKVQINYFKN